MSIAGKFDTQSFHVKGSAGLPRRVAHRRSKFETEERELIQREIRVALASKGMWCPRPLLVVYLLVVVDVERQGCGGARRLGDGRVRLRAYPMQKMRKA